MSTVEVPPVGQLHECACGESFEWTKAPRWHDADAYWCQEDAARPVYRCAGCDAHLPAAPGVPAAYLDAEHYDLHRGGPLDVEGED